MLHMMKNKLEKFEPAFYVIFRLLVGFMFFMHGASKLFGWFGGTAQAVTTWFGAAGLIEVIVGILIIAGLWTRLAAFIAAVEMLVAYIKVHAAGGWNPLANKGELALLYFVAFLIMMIYGNGPWSLEKLFSKKEAF